MAKGDISVGFGGMGPSDVRASGIPSMADSVTVPADDTSASWLDRLLETVAGPKATEDPNYGPDSAFAQIYDKYARPMNPLNLLVGAAQEVPALAAKVPLNAARFASRFSPDPNAEQYLSGDDPESIGAKIDALTKTGALSPRDFGQSVGAAGTDIMAMVAGDEAAGLPALSEALPSAVKGLPGLAKTVDWAGTNIGKGGLYGQLLDNDAETGAVAGGIGGAAIGSGEAILSRAAPFLESAAEKSLGRVIAPGKEAWKKFVGKNAQDIIRDVPLSAAAPWREGGGLQGIVDYAQQQADNIGVSLDAAYAARLQPDIAPKLKGIRDQIRSTADNLLQAHGMAVVNLAPETKQALEEIRASLATGRGALNPKDTNISVLQDAASRLQDVVSGLGPEMQRVGMASPLSFQGQTIQRGIARGAQSTAEQGIARAMGDIGDVINTDLVGTRMATEPLARRIDKLRMNFGDMNAAGEFVSTDPAFSNSIEKLAATVRSYGPEMNAQQLRNLAQDWGKIVSGANGRGFLSPMADESMKGAMRAARGEVETTRDALMGDTVRDQSNELAFWKRLSEAAESTAERRVGHMGGGLFGSMATLAGVGGGEYAAHAAGHGLVGSLGLGAGGAAAAAVTVRVMRSPIYNLLSAKTKLAMASALRKGTNAALGTAMRRALLELSLLNHGGLSALGHTDLTATEADAEHHNIINGRGPTPGVLESANPDTVYGAGGSVDPGIEHNQRLLQQQDQIDQSIEEAAPPLDPQTESRVYDKLANTQVASAGLSRLPEWLQTQLINAPDLGPTHPHLQKLANLIAEQTSPLNVAFLGDEALRPLAAGTKLAGASEMVGKGLAAAMAAAGLQTGLEGVVEGRPGKVIGGGTQAALGALGLRGGGLAGAAEEATAALTPAARRAGGFATRLGQGLKAAGTQAVIGPAIGLASTSLADTDLAKSLIPDDETRNAVFNAAGMGIGVGGLAMAAGRGMKGLNEPASVTVEGREIPVVPSKSAQRSKEVLVTVDMGKLDQAWSGSPSFYVPEGGAVGKGSGAIEGRYARFADFVKTADSIEAPEVGVSADGAVTFDNGRHRTAYLRDVGVTEMPVTMDKLSLKHAQQHGLLVDSPASAPLSKRLQAVRDFRETLTDEQHAALVDEIKQAFPPKDKYTKPVHPMTPKTLLKRGEEMSPEAQQFLAAAVTGLDKKGTIAPLELHAMIEGTDYAPKRLVREPLPEDYDYSQQIKGAPLGVQTAAHEDAALDRYMQLAEDGKEGAQWYVKGGREMLAHVGDDPEAARKLSALHSIFSSATSINVNSPFAIKAWIQKQVGRAIKSGRYPKAMSKEAEKVFTGTSDIQQNLKRGAFYNETNEAGGFAKPGVIPRPTNDIWQSEAWGYANADGTPHRSSVTPEMHAWMDRMTQRAVDRANAEGLDGRHNWTLGEMQAAAWTGVRNETLAAAGKKIPPYYDFGTGLTSSYGQGGREPLAAKEVGHLKGLNDPKNRQWLERYDQLMFEATHDDQGRDLITQGVGGLTGKSVRGPGEYKGEVTRGVQTKMSTTMMPGEKLRGIKTRPTDLETSSAELGQAAEAIYALHTGQGMAAFGRFSPNGPVAGRNAFKVALGRTPTEAEFLALRNEMERRGLNPDDNVAKIFDENGFVAKNLGDRRGNRMERMRQAIEALHPDAEITVGRHTGPVVSNSWDVSGQEVGQRYFKAIEPVMEKYQTLGPELQRRIDTKMAQFHKESGGQFLPSKMLTELQTAIRDQGPRAAFASLAAKYGVSAVLLSLLAKQMGWYRVSKDEQQAS